MIVSILWLLPKRWVRQLNWFNAVGRGDTLEMQRIKDDGTSCIWHGQSAVYGNLATETLCVALGDESGKAINLLVHWGVIRGAPHESFTFALWASRSKNHKNLQILLEAGCPMEHPDVPDYKIENSRTNDICSEMIRSERAKRKAATEARTIESDMSNREMQEQDRQVLRL